MPAAIWLPALIAGGAGVAGSAIASHGNTSAAKTNAQAATDAAKIQAETSDKALAEAKDIYNQQRADEGPYRQSGYGAVNALNFGLGLPQQSYVPPTTTLSPPTTAAANQPVPKSGFAYTNGPSAGVNVPSGGTSLGSIGGSGATTRMQGPDGRVYMIPNDKIAEAQQAGGILV